MWWSAKLEGMRETATDLPPTLKDLLARVCLNESVSLEQIYDDVALESGDDGLTV